jgi:hypothetical protein
VIFGIISILHVVRLLAGPEVYVGTYRLGLALSIVVICFTGGLSIWLARLACAGAAKSK